MQDCQPVRKRNSSEAINLVPYIIDGHNLIPKIPGLNLDDVDDELQLIKRLQDFCRVKRKKVVVFFDQAPAGSSGTRTYGCVVAHFIRQGRTADQAIQDNLRRLGGEARNWTVISSDQEVRSSARAVRAKSMRGYAFLRQRPIGNYIVDFFCKDLKLVIEVDGITHNHKQKEDMEKELFLTNLGLKVLRFEDDDVLNHLDFVAREIEHYIDEFER